METLRIVRAAVLFYFPVDRVNPTKRAVEIDLATRMVDRYSFLKFPRTHEEFNNLDDGATFADGAFEGFQVNELKIFPNGVLISTGDSTDRAEALFDDLMGLWRSVGLVFSPEMLTHKSYVSQIAVRFDMDISTINQAISALVADTFEQPTGLGQLGFATLGVTDKLPTVQIQTLAGSKFGSREYWAQAPLTTAKHLAFLQRFEDILRG